MCESECVYVCARANTKSTTTTTTATVVFIINKKGKQRRARKTFSDVPFIGKVVREAGGGRYTVALCTIYINNNVHETAKNKSEIYTYNIIHIYTPAIYRAIYDVRRMKSVVLRRVREEYCVTCGGGNTSLNINKYTTPVKLIITS